METRDRIAIFEQLKAERITLDSDWQKVKDYVYTQGTDFIVETQEPDSFSNQDLFDKTAPEALSTRSSSLVSLLWDGGKFGLKPNPKYFPDKADLNEFFQYATEVEQEEFKKAEADRIFYEAENDEGAFGLSYFFLDGGENNDGLNLILLQVNECYITETVNHRVDGLYRLYRQTVKQVYDIFGENTPDRIKTLYNQNQFNEKVEILHIIQPRLNRNVTLQGKDNLPIESVYIDPKTKEEIKIDGIQSGFPYFPIFISREGKKNGEKYAYSVSMLAIEEIAQINKVREDQIIIANRMADPSIGYDASSLQGNILDTSPGSATPFRLTGRAGVPIFDMVPTKGDLNASEAMIVRLQQTIGKFYSIDRLLDFNSETQMTLGEAQLRAQIRQQSLGSPLAKKRIEKYEPLVKRAFAILLNQGKFGYLPDDPRIIIETNNGIEPKIIPEEILNLMNAGIDPIEFIDVEFYTQFELEKQLLENNTILQVWNNAGLLAQLTQNPEVFDNLDPDKTIKAIGDVSFNVDIFREKKEVDVIRDARAEQVATQNTLNAGEQISNINKNMRT